MTIRKVGSLKTPEEFTEYLAGLELPWPLPTTSEPLAGLDSPMSTPINIDGFTVGNRFAILPMEGWDGTPDGRPTEQTTRRWRRFGLSGAKLIWGGEAVAVRHDGRANPNQLMINAATLNDLLHLRESLVESHRQSIGTTDDLLVGLQLTHSGRYARPNDKRILEPRIAYDHPWLNPRVGLPLKSNCVLTDGEVDQLVEDFISAAVLAQLAGFAFVDVKHCHGYLGHEFLSAFERPGKYGGSLENRTRFAREIITGIRSAAPGLQVGVRLSGFDFVPFKSGPDGIGVPDLQTGQPYPYAFGGDGTGLGFDLHEPVEFIRSLVQDGVRLVCVTGGSPYYCPHIQRPAYYPPSDGYLPPEDPLKGAARQIAFTAQLKKQVPQAVIVGSAYSCLQEWLPNVAQAVIENQMADFVGLGRMVLSYPQLPADVLAGQPIQRKKLCRTFSDCTSAPRAGLISGCYPLDEYYKDRPEHSDLEKIKTHS